MKIGFGLGIGDYLLRGEGLDPDTVAYITVAGITDLAEINVANNFILALKSAGLFTTSKFEVINPCLGFAGLTASQSRYAKTISVINPTNAKKMTYVGVPNVDKEGILWGGASYGDSGYLIGDLNAQGTDTGYGLVGRNYTSSQFNLLFSADNVMGISNGYVSSLSTLGVFWGDPVLGGGVINVDTGIAIQSKKLMGLNVKPSVLKAYVDATLTASLGTPFPYIFSGYTVKPLLIQSGSNDPDATTDYYHIQSSGLSDAEILTLEGIIDQLITAKAAL